MGTLWRSTFAFALGTMGFILACGRSTTALPGSTDATYGTGGGLIETGGFTSTGGSPSAGGTLPPTPTGGVTATGGASPSGGNLPLDGGAMALGGNSPTGGNPPPSGGSTLTSGGTTLPSGGTPPPSGGSILASGGIALTGGAFVVGSGGVLDAGPVAGRPAFPPKFFGNTDTRGSIRSDFIAYWDQFTPENAGKWASVQATAGKFNWTTLDTLYKHCEDNHILFKEQSFIWGAAQPSWINNNNAAEVARAWMKSFCDRYPNTRIIDVVNEPLHMIPAYREGLGGAGTSGWDWIVNSFKWAREACPNAILLVNDYNILEYATDHQRFLDLVKGTLAAGAPISAIGAQGHDLNKVKLSTVQAHLDALISQTGLPVYITEMDLGVADDLAQATWMKDLVTTFWTNPNVPGITYWGYVAGATWRANTELITSSGTPRPALTWLMEYLHR